MMLFFYFLEYCDNIHRRQRQNTHIINVKSNGPDRVVFAFLAVVLLQRSSHEFSLLRNLHFNLKSESF